MTFSRRRFLTQSAGAAGALSVSWIASAQGGGTASAGLDPWIEVHPAHLRHNVRVVATAAGGRPILAVIKNNGYGLGVVHAGRILETEAAVYGLAVVKLQEAMALRDAGVKKPVLCMGPVTEADLVDAHARDIMPMVYTPIGDVLDRAAAKVGRPVRIHVCVDTGIGRVGVPHGEAERLVRDLASRRSVVIDGMMMTFTEDLAFDREQLARFLALTGSLKRDGLEVGRRHAASSYTFFQHDDAWLDMVRTGMVLYGVFPEPGFRKGSHLDLKVAVALRTRVAYVKKLAAGGSAGYNRAFVTPQDTWLATLPVGHADGWPRIAAKGARVRINGRLFPVVASVSASHTIVNLGADASARIGDEATLFDGQEGSRPEDVAADSGASVYDLLMHLSPLLPRRVIEA